VLFILYNTENKKLNSQNKIKVILIISYIKYKMIIPIKCFTCGNVLADKYRYYLAEVRRRNKVSQGMVDKVVYLSKENMEKTAHGIVLDDLGLHNVCCRRHMLTHVDIE